MESSLSFLNILTSFFLPHDNIYSDIVFDPSIPSIWLWIGGFILLSLGIYSFSLKLKGSLLRFIFGAFILLCLSNPVLIQEERESQKNTVLLLIDDSASQKIGNRGAQSLQARNHIEAEILKHSNTLDLKIIHLSDINTLDGISGRTNLKEALQNAHSNMPINRTAGTILITDGQGHDLPLKSETIPATETYISSPMHVFLTGQKDEIDRQITIIDLPAYGIVGEEVELAFRIDQQAPKSADQNGLVTLNIDGQKPKRMTIPVGSIHKLKIPLERRGRLTLSLKVDMIADEISTSNNETAISINAVRDRLKVLLVSGVPHQGERTWRNLLKSDPSVDLVHFTILRPPEKQDDTPVQELSLIAFPTRELFQTKLHEFDLVVFDRYRRRGVLPSIYLRNIVKYVEQGGAFLEVGGPSYASPYSLYRTPLGDILPGEPNGIITQQPFKPKLTEDGLRHPVTARLPLGPLTTLNDDIRWGRWLRQISVEAKDGDILMNGLDEQPLLVLNRVDKGRVAQLFSDQIWLWAHGYEGGGPYAELIRRLSHWLMKEPELEENDLRAEINGNTLHVSMRSLLPLEANVRITGPNDFNENLVLKHLSNGKYEGKLSINVAGIYHINNGEKSILATQDQDKNQEWQNIISTKIPLRPIVKASNGSIDYIENGLPHLKVLQKNQKTSGRNWIGLKDNHAFIVTGSRYVDILSGWFALLVGGILALAYWRKETG